MRSGIWKLPGALALLISLGLGSARPSVALADPQHGGGYGGYRWNGMSWNPVPGGAARLAVAPDGTPWVINRQGAIFKRHHNNWRQLPGLARDIGIGADGRVWLIGTNPVPGGFGVYQWNGADWSPIEGGATNIAVGPSGVPMVANAEGRVFALEQAGPPMPPPPMPPPPLEHLSIAGHRGLARGFFFQQTAVDLNSRRAQPLETPTGSER